ncbi:MAG: hypothetical protein WCI93_04305, partial [bacterium]
KKLIRFVESFVLLPVMTIGMPQGILPKDSVNVVLTPQAVLSQKLNIETSGLFALNQVVDQEAQNLKIQADAIDAYFKEHNMPLEGTGMKMAIEAQKNDLDYRLLPAIAARETTGGRSLCKNPKAQNNPFGWGSCRIGFKSFDDAIETVAKHLGGNMETTAKHYDNKTTDQILKAYNPPSVVKNYAKQVKSIMEDIGPEEVITDIVNS